MIAATEEKNCRAFSATYKISFRAYRTASSKEKKAGIIFDSGLPYYYFSDDQTAPFRSVLILIIFVL